jgi:hypothetical protein
MAGVPVKLQTAVNVLLRLGGLLADLHYYCFGIVIEEKFTVKSN